jgi:hypothetical protein
MRAKKACSNIQNRSPDYCPRKAGGQENEAAESAEWE